MIIEELPEVKIDKSDSKSLRESIIKWLHDRVYSGYLPPGSRIIESQLASKFQISRTPVREALFQLESEGLVKIIPNRGAIVNIFSVNEIAEIHLIFGALEGVAASLSVEVIDEEGIKKMEDCINKMEVSKEYLNKKEWFSENDEFHKAFIKPCEKKILLKLIKNYTKQVGRYWYLMLSYPGSIQLFHQEHKEIFEAFKLRNSKMARERVENHVMSFRRVVVESLKMISSR